jgi:hypothetical protein
MYKEPEVLPILLHALRSLDYPAAKLDIKLVLEEGDRETVEAAIAMDLEGIFEIVLVPPSQPKTKPKACNYALQFARGEHLVIYDAEDKPEPDQLRKVVAAFRRGGEKLACVQCRLNYYNARENWLTRMFTLDYSLWFDLMLPGLQRLGAPIPLGGTSNHFRTDVLRALHAWDPFNVTEDADLGIRLTQKGWRVAVIDSTTYEEANCLAGNWVRQRSRWIKGYMQTFLVHTRRPAALWRAMGPVGLLGFVFFIGGTAVSGLLSPVLWAILLAFLLLPPGLRGGRAAAGARLCGHHQPAGRQWALHLADHAGAAPAPLARPLAAWPDGGRLLGDDVARRLEGALAARDQALLLGEDAARPFAAGGGGACAGTGGAGGARGTGRGVTALFGLLLALAYGVALAALLAGQGPWPGLLAQWGEAALTADGSVDFAQFTTAYPPLPYLLSAAAEAVAGTPTLPGPLMAAALAGGALGAAWFAGMRQVGLPSAGAAAATLLLAAHPFTLAALAAGPGPVMAAGAAWWLGLSLAGCGQMAASARRSGRRWRSPRWSSPTRPGCWWRRSRRWRCCSPSRR